MSIASMTGFGRGEAAAGGLRAAVEISSVNRRQFECQTTLPRALAGLDARVQDAIREVLSRGHVKATVTLATDDARTAAPSFDLAVWRARIAAVRAAAATLNLPDDLAASALLNAAEGSAREERTIGSDEAWAVIAPALRAAIESLLEMRRREGGAILADLRARLATLRALATEIAARAPEVPTQYHDTLRRRINELLAPQGQTLDAQTLAREVALFADRCDIREELTRLSSHLDQAEALLASREPCGRALDFLCQELFREINTTGAKANDAAITRCVIAFKTELEAMREQAQNIE